jgi:glycerol-3-phosphate dehydrogenase
MAQTAVEQGATIINYTKVVGLQKKGGLIRGVIVQDMENSKEYELNTRVVINATGVFSDHIRSLADSDIQPMIVPSQGVHIVLDKSFLPGDTAIMIPQTDDGRVLFAIPWHERVLVGTTDTALSEITLEPQPLQEEIDFLISHAARYLSKDPTHTDILSVFAGIRPLVKQGNAENTAELSRDHTLHISPSGLLTIAGGKWTTYRKMAEDTIDHAIVLADLVPNPSATMSLNIHGHHTNAEKFKDLADYGSDAIEIRQLLKEKKVYGDKIHPKSQTLIGEIIWAARREMARTVEDFLSRRTRNILLNAATSMDMAPIVAKYLAKELGRNKGWEKQQVEDYRALAKGYLGIGN